MIIIQNEDNKTLNEKVEENNPETSSVEEQTTEEVVKPVEETESTEKVDSTEKANETGGKSKKGYSQRVREVVNERNQIRKENKSLKERIANLTKQGQEVGLSPSAKVDDKPLVAPGEEIDALELDRRLRAREQKLLERVEAMTTIKTKQSEAVNRINNETQEVLKTYSELDPESDNFNKDLSDSIYEAVEAHIKVNPYTASVKGIVAKLMKPYKGAVSKEVGEATKTIAKQVSQAALKPTNVKQGEKDAKDKTIAELEQELGVVQS